MNAAWRLAGSQALAGVGFSMYSQSHPAVQRVHPGLRRVRKMDELRARALV